MRLAATTASTNTFAVVADELLAKKRREAKAPATLIKFEWLMSFAKPTMGARPIASITSSEVLAVLRPVEVRGGLETARRMRAVMSEVFRYAAATGRAETDPTTILKGALTAPVVRHRAAIIEPKSFGELLRAIDGHEGMLEARLALQLLALTFTRPGELGSAKWAEFDFINAVWAIPAEKMKMRRPHRVPSVLEEYDLLASCRRQMTG